jgi:hypothetical protein
VQPKIRLPHAKIKLGRLQIQNLIRVDDGVR